MLSRWVEQELLSCRRCRYPPRSSLRVKLSRILGLQLLVSKPPRANQRDVLLPTNLPDDADDEQHNFSWWSSRRRTSYNLVLGCSIAVQRQRDGSLKSPPLRGGRNIRYVLVLLWVLIFAVLLCCCCCWLSSVDDEWIQFYTSHVSLLMFTILTNIIIVSGGDAPGRYYEVETDWMTGSEYICFAQRNSNGIDAVMRS